MSSSTKSKITPITSCVACASSNLKPTLDLGKQPLANSLKKRPDDKEDKFPLAINTCQDCFHTQLTHCVNPDLLFKNYVYVSGISKPFLDFADWFAHFAHEYTQYSIEKRSVLDIGCNDGTQLDFFRDMGYETVGVDPAENLQHIGIGKGHKIIADFYGEKHTPPPYSGMEKPTSLGVFDLVICQNAFAHNDNQLEYLSNMKQNLAFGGHIIVTTSQADMILNGEFDTIYHEHISFYTIKSMNALARRAGLYLVDAFKNPIHGTSYIFVMVANIGQARPFYIENLIAMEEKAGLYSPSTYIDYANTVKENVKAIKRTVKRLQKDHALVGLGAAAKGNTFLNYSKIVPDIIIDDTPQKQGLYTPGTGTAIEPMSALDAFVDVQTMVFMPLAWNFYDALVAKVKSMRPGKKDIFIRTFPNLSVEYNV